MESIIARMLRKERRNIKGHIKSVKIYDKYISNSKKHLDFGCGFGCVAYLLACEHPKMKVVGIDIKKPDIMAGRKRYNAPNLKLLVSSKINGKFDSISSFDVLHHLKDVKYYIDQFCSRLNPHGKVIILEHRKVSRKKFMELYYKPRTIELSKSKVKTFHLDSFEEEYQQHGKWNVKQFVSMMEKAGFKSLEVKPFEINLMYIGEKRK
jgi:ubiquinone/menaquinone biosynthesis C-methylase UbiE